MIATWPLFSVRPLAANSKVTTLAPCVIVNVAPSTMPAPPLAGTWNASPLKNWKTVPLIANVWPFSPLWAPVNGTFSATGESTDVTLVIVT